MASPSISPISVDVLNLFTFYNCASTRTTLIFILTVERHFLSAERDGIRKFDFFPSKTVRPSAGLRPATLDIYANQYITAGPFSELYNLIITKVHFLPANNYFTLIYISQTVLLRIQKF